MLDELQEHMTEDDVPIGQEPMASDAAEEISSEPSDAAHTSEEELKSRDYGISDDGEPDGLIGKPASAAADVLFPDPFKQSEEQPSETAAEDAETAGIPVTDALEPEGMPSSDGAAASAEKKNIAGIVMMILIFLAVVGFSVFCIIWDIRKGSPSNGYVAGDVVSVNIGQQRKPVSKESMVDESGRYTVAGIAEAVMPSIVEIYTYQKGELIGTGSGILLSEDGYLVTNAHVVANGDSYNVTLHDDRKYDGTLMGHDSKTDIAVMKIEASGLQPAVLGDSDEVQLGEEVCALGNPARLSGSISSGIVSGLNRQIQAQSNTYEMECIQTDAAISSGNSGGALVNRYGQVIGITSSKYTSNFMMGVSYEGLGFAITINAALPIIKELIEQGYVSGRVRIGIQFYEAAVAAETEGVTVPEEFGGKGILVVGVDEDSDLAKTTFKPYDWILEMNGKSVSDYESVLEAIKGCGAGDSIHAHCATVDSEGRVTYYEIDFTLLEDTSGEY